MFGLPLPVEGIVEQEVEEGLLLLRETGDYLLVNKTGALIWNELHRTRSIEELAESLRKIPGAPTLEKLHQTVLSYIDELIEAGFLRKVE